MENETDQDDAVDLMDEEEAATHYTNMIAAMLERTKLVELVEQKAAIGQVHLMFRCRKENEGQLINGLVDKLFDSIDGVCDSFICKQYFKRQGKMRYGWVFSFGAKDLREVAQKVGEGVDAFMPRFEVLEAPLMGPGTPQGAPGGRNGKKGATPVRG